METSGPQTGTLEKGDRKHAEHLVVLIHGLWGNPGHLQNLIKALQEKHGDEKVRILAPLANANNNTYDGIDVGAERTLKEIEDEISQTEKDGGKYKRLSIIGYSLGGLVARYCVGLLYARGWFDKMEPVNFTTFATPHLGVRAPNRTWLASFFNTVGSKTLSTSGNQMFCIDSYRDTGRPLLDVMADPNSIFMNGLKSFKHLIAYSNITNDRSVPYFTANMALTDPYTDLTTVQLNPLEGYDGVILDPSNPVKKKAPPESTIYSSIVNTSSEILSSVPFYAAATIFLPFGFAAYMGNAAVQSFRSSQRRNLHTEGKSGHDYSEFRISPLLEETLEQINGEAPPDHLGSKSIPDLDGIVDERTDENAEQTIDGFPVLALSSEQFKMVKELGKLNWKRYPVYIKEVMHTHAAIIVRMNRNAFAEGKVVLRHWMEESFEL